MLRNTIALIFCLHIIIFHANAEDSIEPIEIGQKYYDHIYESWEGIFPDGNRNAAGPKFFSFALEQSLTAEDFVEYNKMYCSVSGSLLRPGDTPDLVRIYEEDTNNLICGEYYRCCWPCTCDLMKYAKTKKAKFTFDNTDHEFYVLTIKDPCAKDNFPRRVNKNYFCKNDKLDKEQVFTVGGDLVIGLLHNASECTTDQLVSIASNEMTGAMCEFRNSQPIEEVQGGMGDIFIQMAN